MSLRLAACVLALAASAPSAESGVQPGGDAWFVGHPNQRGIAGYAGATSYAPGDMVRLYVDSHGDRFGYDVYRMGSDVRLVATRRGLANGSQSAARISG